MFWICCLKYRGKNKTFGGQSKRFILSSYKMGEAHERGEKEKKREEENEQEEKEEKEREKDGTK